MTGLNNGKPLYVPDSDNKVDFVSASCCGGIKLFYSLYLRSVSIGIINRFFFFASEKHMPANNIYRVPFILGVSYVNSRFCSPLLLPSALSLLSTPWTLDPFQ